MINSNMSDIVPSERYQKQFYKTSMCKYFLENSCKKGHLCSHAHSPEELQEKPVLSKTRMCKQILRMGHCSDSECTFAHEIDELVAANAFFRTKMCEFFVSASGCKLGDKCRYAHSSSELSESVNMPVKKSIPTVDFNDSPETGYPMRKKGSMGSRSTMAGGYSSFGSMGSFHDAPVVYVYPYAPALYQAYLTPYED